MSLGPDNRSRGYGTVLLATAEDAGRAIDMFNGYNWQTRVLEVRPDRLPPDLEGQSAPAAAQGVPLLSPMGVQSAYPPALASPLGQTFFHSDELLSRPASSAPGARTLFVGNVRAVLSGVLHDRSLMLLFWGSCHSIASGRTSKISSAKPERFSVPMWHWDKTAARADLAWSRSPPSWTRTVQ